MTSDAIRALIASDPEAVVALVERLFAHIAALEAEVAARAEQIATFSARVKELEERLALDSHNSSKPPSSDPVRPRPRPQSLRQPSGKKPGGQPGHPGPTLRQVETPDRLVRSSPAQCRACGASLVEVAPTAVERRQVIDVPPVKLEVVEYQAETKTCPACQAQTAGTFPAGVTQPVQYGERLLSVGVSLQVGQLLPYERTREVLEDLFGAAPSEGTLDTAIQRCSAGLATTETTIKEGLQQAETAHFDESGAYVGGKRHWFHVSSTAHLTHYAWHPKRGKEATDAIGILPAFAGRAIHDAWSPYFRYGCAHGLCNAHHLRELTFLEEQDQQAWAGELKTLLRTSKARVAEARAAGQDRLDEATRHAFTAQYQAIVAAGLAANPAAPRPPPGTRGRPKQTKARNLLERLQTHQEAALAFLNDFRVPFDNSQAERDIRMLKVQQKVSGCFRREGGATAFCRIRSYLSTMRKQGQRWLPAIEHVFAGSPFTPSLRAE